MSIPYSDLLKIFVLLVLYCGVIYQAASYFYLFHQNKLEVLNARHMVLSPNYDICDLNYNPYPECKDPVVSCKVTYQKCREIVKSATTTAKGRCDGYIDSYNSCVDTLTNNCNNLRVNIESCVDVIVRLNLDQYK